MKKSVFLVMLILAVSFTFAGGGSDGAKSGKSNTVVIYSPHDASPLNDAVNEFRKVYPDINVEVVAAGTGELLNRIRAESANPIADVIWGGQVDSLESFSDYFEPFVSSADEFIDEAFKSSEDKWIGESPLPMVIIYNKELIAEEGMENPTGWEDLLEPEWKGKIAYALPSKSGSAYTQLCTMIQGHGSPSNDYAEGWVFIEDLIRNSDGRLLDSSSNAHKLVSDGEFFAGLTLEKAAVLYNDRADIGYVYPDDGTSAVPDGVAMIKNAPNKENAELFINFVLSKDCQLRQSQEFGRRPIRSDTPVEGLPSAAELTLVDYDFEWASSNKEAIMDRFNDILVEIN